MESKGHIPQVGQQDQLVLISWVGMPVKPVRRGMCHRCVLRTRPMDSPRAEVAERVERIETILSITFVNRQFRRKSLKSLA